MAEVVQNISAAITYDVINVGREGNTTESPETLTNEQLVPPPFVYILSGEFLFYSLSIIAPIGLICNMLSIIVFTSRRMRHRSTSIYLAVLAAADSVELVTLILDYWLKNKHIDLNILQLSPVLCVSVTYFSYTSRLFSAWLVCSFTAERFLAVTFPFRRNVIGRTYYVKITLMVEIVTCLVLSSYIFFTIGIVQRDWGNDCDVRPDRERIYLICSLVIYVAGSVVLPILAVCTMNTLIIRAVYSSGKLTRKTLGGGSSKTARQIVQDRTTAKALLVVSTTFVLLNLPYCVSSLVLYFTHHVVQVGWIKFRRVLLDSEFWDVATLMNSAGY